MRNTSLSPFFSVRRLLSLLYDLAQCLHTLFVVLLSPRLLLAFAVGLLRVRMHATTDATPPTSGSGSDAASALAGGGRKSSGGGGPTLLDVIGLVAQNGYAADVWQCAGICRETWTCIPTGLTSAEAARVRRDHLLWQAIVDLPLGRVVRTPSWDRAWFIECTGGLELTRLMRAARRGDAVRVAELCAWNADVEVVDGSGRCALAHAANAAAACALLCAGARVEGAGSPRPLLVASAQGRSDVVRALLAAGADPDRVSSGGATARTAAGLYTGWARDAVLRELDRATPCPPSQKFDAVL